MKHVLLAAAAAASLVAFAPAAQAAPIVAGSSIDFSGFLQALGGATLGQATGLDFVAGASGAPSPGVAGVIPTYGSGTGTFAGLFCPTTMMTASCGAIADLTNLTVGAQNVASFFTLQGGNNPSPIIFDLTGITDIGRSNPNFLTFTATGTLRYDGFDATPATFLFSSQGSTSTSFSATAIAGSAVPEPATWAMMFLGFGGVGYAMRRKTKVAARIRFA